MLVLQKMVLHQMMIDGKIAKDEDSSSGNGGMDRGRGSQKCPQKARASTASAYSYKNP